MERRILIGLAISGWLLAAYFGVIEPMRQQITVLTQNLSQLIRERGQQPPRITGE